MTSYVDPAKLAAAYDQLITQYENAALELYDDADGNGLQLQTLSKREASKVKSIRSILRDRNRIDAVLDLSLAAGDIDEIVASRLVLKVALARCVVIPYCVGKGFAEIVAALSKQQRKELQLLAFDICDLKMEGFGNDSVLDAAAFHVLGSTLGDATESELASNCVSEAMGFVRGGDADLAKVRQIDAMYSDEDYHLRAAGALALCDRIEKGGSKSAKRELHQAIGAAREHILHGQIVECVAHMRRHLSIEQAENMAIEAFYIADELRACNRRGEALQLGFDMVGSVLAANARCAEGAPYKSWMKRLEALLDKNWTQRKSDNTIDLKSAVFARF